MSIFSACCPGAKEEPEPEPKGAHVWTEDGRLPIEYTYGRGLPPTEEDYMRMEAASRHQSGPPAGGCFPAKPKAPARPLRPPVPDVKFIQFVEQGPEILTLEGAQRDGFCGCGELRGCGCAGPGRGCGPEPPNPFQMRDMAEAPVTVHVYYVGNSETIQNISAITKELLGQGGVFHGAIEIYGREWSYGGGNEGTGVFQVPPRSCGMHTYRESMYLGDAKMSEAEVFEILKGLIVSWQVTIHESGGAIDFAQSRA